jgi:hypothetical protein
VGKFQSSYGALPASMVQASAFSTMQGEAFAGPRYDAYKENPDQWWAAAPARVLLRAGGGAIGIGLAGYILGALAPGVSRQQGAKWGAIAGAASGALAALVPPSQKQ